MKNKKIGFTLIELLAVIIVLAIIALIATPIIFNVIENAKLKSLENSCYGVIDGVRTKYAEGLLNSIDGTVKLKGNVTEITVSGEQPIEGTWEIDNSRDSNNRGVKIKDVKFGSMKDYTCTNINSDGTINSKVTCTKGGNNDEPTSEYTDNSGANKPELFDNMVAIKYENEKWLVANTSEKWYDYDAKEWANAVVLNSGVTKNVGDEVTEEDVALWYVWIPRYKYTIFNGNNEIVSEQLINVTFESGTNRTGTVTCTDNADGSETVSSFFTAIQKVKTTYGINNADSHMMKNMEWGAVAYLKQSQYGLGTTYMAVNDNSIYYTGGGISDAYKTNVAQSTTGNEYGVYDMSGGAFEYVMGNMKNSGNAFYSSNAGFTTAPDAKYYDSYKYDTSYTSHARGKLGDATKETLTAFGFTYGGWYSDYTTFSNSSYSWFLRGGHYSQGTYAGVFYFNSNKGNAFDSYSARAVLSAQ